MLPRYEYSYFGEPDALGGRSGFDTSDFNVMREQGTNTQRAGGSAELAAAVPRRARRAVQADAARATAPPTPPPAWTSSPTTTPSGSTETVRAHADVALKMRWPFVRDGGDLGTPDDRADRADHRRRRNTARSNSATTRIPNEDSLDFEFTDQNLFALNRFPGIDRLEGGPRANVGAACQLDLRRRRRSTALVGQCYRIHQDNTFPIGSGLENTRLRHRHPRHHHAGALVRPDRAHPVGPQQLQHPLRRRAWPAAGAPAASGVNAGYIYTADNPYFLYDTPPTPAQATDRPATRSRSAPSTSTAITAQRLRAATICQRDKLSARRAAAPTRTSASSSTSTSTAATPRINGDSGASIVLFQITFKTVGQFGFHAF